MASSVLVYSICFLALFSCAHSEDKGGHGWNYDKLGPDSWPHEFENCKGKRQSPINVETDKLEYDRNLKQFTLTNYMKNQNWNVTHNGHAVVISQISDDSKVALSVKGSDFEYDYELLQFHFHWGQNDYQGSEHYIDSDKFPLEMHLVHKSKQGTLTVLGFMFKLSKTDNLALNPVLNGVAVAKNENHWKNVSFAMSSILPELTSLDKYYRYLGSLTTPPCTEGVKWNLFTEAIEISAKQLESFRVNDLKLNFRDPQKIYSRKVFSSFAVKKSKEAAAHSKTAACSQALILNQSNSIIFLGILIFQILSF